MCPHILRYLTTAVITNRRRRQAHHHQLLKDLVKVIQQVGSCALVLVYCYCHFSLNCVLLSANERDE